MTLHEDLVLGLIHSCTAKTFTDIAARDADTSFQITENIDKMVRVNSPAGYFMLRSINPAVWIETSNTGNDAFLEMVDTPSSYSTAGKVVQINTAGNALEFGQKLRTSDNPIFDGLSILASFNVECNANLNAGLFVANDSIFSATVDVEGALNVSSNIITLNSVGTPTDVTADQGGLVLKGDTDKTIRWLNGFDAWFLNQNVIVNNQLSVGAAGGPTTDASIDLLAPNKALLHNRVTTAQRDALTAVAGMVVYNTTTNDLEYRTNTVWKTLSGGQDLTPTANPTFNDLTLTGDLTVQGTTTTIDTTTLVVEDKNIELGNVTTPTDVTADGGGITLKGTTDKTITWNNASNAWTFNQDIDALGNIIKTTGIVSAGIVIATTQVFAGNLLLSGNTLSSTNANGDIILAPNGTGEVVVDNFASAAGGVFKFTSNAFRAGLDAVEYVEIGHGGGNGFINAVGDGGLDFRFEGTTLATFTDFGHLHLLTNVDQKHTLKIITNNNLNDTGIAWENSGGDFTATIFRTDAGVNTADLIFAAGKNANVDLLTNSFKIHGSAANEGKLEILGTLQISSGSPLLDKVLTSDADGVATWQSPQATAGGWTDDGTVVRLSASTDNVVIGANSGNGKLDVHGTPGTSVGGFASGQFQVTGVGAAEFSNSVVTGHNLFGGNTQLWYLGSTSSSNNDIAFINRQNAKLLLYTNNIPRATILADGKFGVNELNPIEQFDVNGNVKCNTVVDNTIYAQLNSSVDQVPTDTNPTVITYNTQDAINGLTHSTTVNPGEITIDTAGIYFVSPQPQVGKDTGAAKTDFDMFLQVDRGSGFADENNSNIKLTIKDSDITDVIVSNFTIQLNVGDKIRMMQRVSSSTVGLGLKNTDPVVGPPTTPRTPSIIFTMYRVGGI